MAPLALWLISSGTSTLNTISLSDRNTLGKSIFFMFEQMA